MYLSGRVHSILFEDQSLYIMKMVLDKPEEGDAEVFRLEGAKYGEPVTVKGHVPGPQLKVGSWFGFEAHWVKHPKYGRQLAITSAPLRPPSGWTEETAVKALLANGVGESVVQLLQFHHGENLPDALNDKQRILETEGLDEFSAMFVHARWQKVQANFRGMEFLLGLELPPAVVRKVWSTFGDDATEVLGSNPWELVRIPGVSFQQADEIALRMGLKLESPGRLKAAVLSVLRNQTAMGHLYQTSGQMVAGVQALVPDASQKQIGEAIVACHKDGSLIVERGVRQGVTAIYDPWFAEIEREAARLLRERVQTAAYSDTGLDTERYIKSLKNMGPHTSAAAEKEGATLIDVVKAALEEWQASEQMMLAEKQKQGVINALTQPVSIITGLPGSGKSTLTKAVVRILQEAGIQILLASPTAIAAKNLTHKTGAQAYTLHRAFSAKGGSEDEEREAGYTGIVGESQGVVISDKDGEWGYGPNSPHPAEFVLVDEFSMADAHLLYRVLLCTSPQTRLVFVGDAAQLPSVGPGNVLRDLVNSGIFATVQLDEIFRQKDTSAIVYAAHAIHKGEMPECEPPSDFSLVSVHDEHKALQIILKLAERLFAKRENFQILSPRHSGVLGVTNLNAKLRDLLNPPNSALREIRIGEDLVREDDRIMVIRNDYKLGVVNGDVGKVARIDNKEKVIELKIHGDQSLVVEMPFKDAASTIRLAYACTVHKCVAPDTLVETPKGLEPIRDIAGEGEIATPNGVKPYRNKVINDVGPVIRLVTERGYDLTATPDHGLDVWDGEAYSRKEAGDVKIGDWVRLVPGAHFRSEAPDLPPLPGGSARHPVPTRLNSDFAEFLGLMVAGGSVYDKGFRLANRHVDVIERFEELCRKLFAVGPKRVATGTNLAAEVESELLSAWLLSVGGLNPRDKRVPQSILHAPTDIQASFLRGLMGDGAVHLDRGVVDHVAWERAVPEMLQAVRLLFLRQGIITRTVKTKAGGRLCLYGSNIDIFKQKVGFISAFKRDRLEKPCRPEKNASLPVSEKEAEALKEFHDVIGRYACRNAKARGYISRNTAQAVVGTGRQHPLVDALRDRLRFHHERVESVEAGEAPTMCVEVPDGHQFVQNGFSGWNCQGLEYDVIVMPVVESFRHQLQRNLLYTAVTRAKQKVILVGSINALGLAVANDREDLRNTLLKDRLENPM